MAQQRYYALGVERDLQLMTLRGATERINETVEPCLGLESHCVIWPGGSSVVYRRREHFIAGVATIPAGPPAAVPPDFGSAGGQRGCRGPAAAGGTAGGRGGGAGAAGDGQAARGDVHGLVEGSAGRGVGDREDGVGVAPWQHRGG